MRAVIQRVTHSSVTVDGQVVGAIGRGLLVLVAVAPTDDAAACAWMADKITHLRIFPDEADRMDRSILDLGLAVLAVSQFTLYGNCRKGRRPSFVGAAPPDIAEPLYERFCEALRALGVPSVAQGRFGADMAVALVNDGPVTLVIDSP